MQVKKNSLSSIQYRANRANRKASQDNGGGPPVGILSNKEIVAAASKIQVSRKDPVKPSPGQPHHERIPTSPTPEEQIAKVATVCYLEQQQKAEGSNSVSCFRSTGAVNIPTRRCSTITPRPPLPPPPRKASMPEPLALQTAQTVPLEPFEDGELKPIRKLLRPISSDEVAISVQEDDKEVIIYDPKVSKAPPARYKHQCVKHSKCHCHLFSQHVDGFFTVAN